jgi:hypothetical protein
VIVMDMGLSEDGERTTEQPDNPGRSRLRERLRPLRDWARRHPRLAWAASLVIVALVLFFCYLRETQTYQLGADPAAQALQAWQMWHGNPLLRGWWLGDVNFYTVELPMNVIIEMVNGLKPNDVHIGAALVYMAVVVLTAVLARGNARGREGVVRALLGAGIMLAPSLVYGTRVLMQGPDHMGTMIPILLMLLVLDRAPERWWVVVAVGALLTLAQVSDPLATYAAAVALGLACAVRACSEIVRRQRPQKGRLYDASLVAAALVSVALAHLILAKIHSAGGFYFPPPKNGVGFAPLSQLPVHSRLTGYSVLILFGADFVGQPFGVNTFLALLHLVGVALGCWALWIGLRGFFSRMDRVTQALVAGTIIILVAGAFGTYMTAPVVGAHEIIPVLPFCAALAGRLLGGRLVRARLEPVLAVGLACYLGALAYNDVQPVQAPAHQDLADWLTAHQLRYGLAGYWESNITTLDSDGRVRVASLADYGTSADPYESDSSWYNPAVSTADFIVSVSSPTSDAKLIKASVLRARFGQPSRTYHFEEYTVRVYGYNLLTRLNIPTEGGFSSAGLSRARPPRSAQAGLREPVLGDDGNAVTIERDPDVHAQEVGPGQPGRHRVQRRDHRGVDAWPVDERNDVLRPEHVPRVCQHHEIIRPDHGIGGEDVGGRYLTACQRLDGLGPGGIQRLEGQCQPVLGAQASEALLTSVELRRAADHREPGKPPQVCDRREVVFRCRRPGDGHRVLVLCRR